MKKKLMTALLAIILFATFLPTRTYAEECTTHQWGEWYEITAASCMENGLKERTCTECYATEEMTIPAIGHHTWGKWVTEQKSTCGWTGWKSRECNRCHTTEGTAIPKTKTHSWGKWRTTKRATALSKGKKSRYCSKCDKSETKSTPKLKASVSLKEKSVTIKTGKSRTLRVKKKTYGDKIRKWTSSNKKVATVTSRGKVTGKRKGTATITLTMKSGAKAKCKVKVTKPKQSIASQSGNAGSQSNNSGSSGNNVPAPYSGYVWIPNSGKKYHISSTCSGMKNPRQVTIEEAISAGYEPCSKCY